jgi:2-oxoacid:acceptor oxidoreductase delta subunit (pyruvate/2-ketoisovalerate family)
MLLAPTSVTLVEGKVAGMICQRMKLGDPDESGRRAPVPIPASEIELPADTILAAIGEEIETSIIPSALHLEAGTIKTLPGGRTEWRNLFVGGDFTAGPRTVVAALADGKRGAIAIDAWLRQKDPAQVLHEVSIRGTGPALMARYVESRQDEHPAGPAISGAAREDHVVGFDELNAAYFVPSNPAPTPELPPSERLHQGASAEILLPLADEARAGELQRCFHCGRCTECDNCYIYCPDVAIAKLERGFAYDFRYCKGCGVCATECPRAAIAMTEEPTEF